MGQGAGGEGGLFIVIEMLQFVVAAIDNIPRLLTPPLPHACPAVYYIYWWPLYVCTVAHNDIRYGLLVRMYVPMCVVHTLITCCCCLGIRSR